MTERALLLHRRLASLGVDAVLFNTSEVVPSTNLRYLSGFCGSDASLLITRTERLLFTDGRYKTQAKEQVTGFRIRVVRNKPAALAGALKSSGVKRLGIESPRISYEFVTRLARRVPGVEIVPLKERFLEEFRICKADWERERIKRAAEIASEACREVVEAGLEGRRECDVAADIEAGFRVKGAERVAFETIVASGVRSALPHGTATARRIERNDPVIIDFGCRYEGYCSDETVTCVVGTAASEFVNIHSAVYDAHMKALDAAREGMKARDLDRVARESIEKAGFGKYFMHGLGHGVGMEIHEPPHVSPRGRGVLKVGMVFTIEPGVYIEGIGGVRLESLVYLGTDGAEVLCQMPKDLIAAD
ncbi:MAG: aminopeptidase P family protein [Desulfomonilaceae bacterium]|nr:aminopeptidase P family protein [Desulfomonilaceae bacterium]